MLLNALIQNVDGLIDVVLPLECDGEKDVSKL